MERDDEISGSGNSYSAEFWQYDSRLGRRWNRDPESHRLPSISPYASFFNNPIVIKDPNGDFGIVGFAIGFGVDIAAQMLANSLTGKPIGDIDYGDAFISGVVGAVSGGLGNAGKLAGIGQKLLTAAKIEGKLASVVIKVTQVVTEEGIKATVDIKASTEEGEYVHFTSVFGEGEFAKDVSEAATDFAVGSTLEVFKGGVKEIFNEIIVEPLKKEQKELVRKLGKSMLKSEGQKLGQEKLESVTKNILIEETVNEGVSGAAKTSGEELTKEKIQIKLPTD
jgi:hypothetical protein